MDVAQGSKSSFCRLLWTPDRTRTEERGSCYLCRVTRWLVRLHNSNDSTLTGAQPTTGHGDVAKENGIAMTDTRTYDVSGATLTVTLVLQQHNIIVSMTVDTSALDKHEPEHSHHNLIAYANLPGWESPQIQWWCKRRRSLTVKTGAQAQRVIRNTIARVSDAVSAAILDRERRKAEMKVAFAV